MTDPKPALIPFRDVKAELLADPEVAAAYAAADAEYGLLEELLRARVAAGLTQAELAARAGTTQSAIARLESGRVSPTVDTLRRYARAVGKQLRIQMV
jgi:DNA-binding XRE family transcriptional regulator